MAAYFTDRYERDYVWNVDQLVPDLFAGICTSVQADGHELEYILALGFKIPDGSGPRVVTWKKDAQVSYDNLKNGDEVIRDLMRDK